MTNNTTPTDTRTLHAVATFLIALGLAAIIASFIAHGAGDLMESVMGATGATPRPTLTPPPSPTPAPMAVVAGESLRDRLAYVAREMPGQQVRVFVAYPSPVNFDDREGAISRIGEDYLCLYVTYRASEWCIAFDQIGSIDVDGA